jgi:hypothetical protein
MEVSGQLHPQAALPPGKCFPEPILLEAGWASKPVWTLWSRKKIILPLPGIEPHKRKYKLQYSFIKYSIINGNITIAYINLQYFI